MEHNDNMHFLNTLKKLAGQYRLAFLNHFTPEKP